MDNGTSVNSTGTVTIQASYFRNVHSIEPVLRRHSPGGFLEQMSTRIWMPAVAGDLHAQKLSTPLLSGAVYGPGATRCRDAVLSVSLAAFDLDNKIEVPTGEHHTNSDGTLSDRPILNAFLVPNPVSVDIAATLLQRAGISGVAYTTLSHTERWPRTRIIIPLSEPVPVCDWPHAVDWVVARLGLDHCRDCIDLAHLRNPAAVSVLPTKPLWTPLVRQRVDGELLRVPIEDIRNFRLPPLPEPEWQRALRLERLARTASIPRTDRILMNACDPAELLRELGCTVFPERFWVHGTKRRTTCPWACEHTYGVDDDAGVVFYPTTGRASWRCSHTGHAHLGVVDLMRATGRW